MWYLIIQLAINLFFEGRLLLSSWLISDNIFVYAFYWIIYVLVLSCDSSLYTLDSNYLADICFTHIFSEHFACLSIFLQVIFKGLKFLILLHFYILCFFTNWFMLFIALRNLCLPQNCKDVHLFSSRDFIALAFIFRFWFILSWFLFMVRG